jgi:hypothetical protein
VKQQSYPVDDVPYENVGVPDCIYCKPLTAKYGNAERTGFKHGSVVTAVADGDGVGCTQFFNVAALGLRLPQRWQTREPYVPAGKVRFDIAVRVSGHHVNVQVVLQ